MVGTLGQAQGKGALGKMWKLRFGHIKCTRTGLDTDTEKQGWNSSPELRRSLARFEAGWRVIGASLELGKALGPIVGSDVVGYTGRLLTPQGPGFQPPESRFYSCGRRFPPSAAPRAWSLSAPLPIWIPEALATFCAAEGRTEVLGWHANWGWGKYLKSQ